MRVIVVGAISRERELITSHGETVGEGGDHADLVADIEVPDAVAGAW